MDGVPHSIPHWAFWSSIYPLLFGLACATLSVSLKYEFVFHKLWDSRDGHIWLGSCEFRKGALKQSASSSHLINRIYRVTSNKLKSSGGMLILFRLCYLEIKHFFKESYLIQIWAFEKVYKNTHIESHFIIRPALHCRPHMLSSFWLPIPISKHMIILGVFFSSESRFRDRVIFLHHPVFVWMLLIRNSTIAVSDWLILMTLYTASCLLLKYFIWLLFWFITRSVDCVRFVDACIFQKNLNEFSSYWC